MYARHVLSVDASQGLFYMFGYIAFALGWSLISIGASETELKFASLYFDWYIGFVQAEFALYPNA